MGTPVAKAKHCPTNFYQRDIDDGDAVNGFTDWHRNPRLRIVADKIFISAMSPSGAYKH
jgi:hypothetical protein